MTAVCNNIPGEVAYIGTSSSCKDSEVAVMWNGWIGFGDKALIIWLPGES